MSLINLNPPSSEPEEKSIKDIEETNTELPVEEQKPKEDDKVIVMDGPLSKIYTQALNIAYAKEAASASGQTDIKVVFPEEESKETKDSLYVYCCDASDITNSDAIDGTDKLRLALDSKKYNQAIVVMECHDKVTQAAGLLEQYAVNNKIKVIFRRELAIEHIRSF